MDGRKATEVVFPNGINKRTTFGHGAFLYTYVTIYIHMKYKDFIKGQTSCPFCSYQINIIEKKHAVLTYSIAPYHMHHMIVAPKRHVVGYLDMTKDELAEMNELILTGLKILHKLGYENTSIVTRDGAVGLVKSVEHLHTHVVPEVHIGDLDHEGKERTIMGRQRIEDTVLDIRKAMQRLGM
jgi:diadenosine tetraphosphate (Ap4A) HIT family hydrolase